MWLAASPARPWIIIGGFGMHILCVPEVTSWMVFKERIRK